MVGSWLGGRTQQEEASLIFLERRSVGVRCGVAVAIALVVLLGPGGWMEVPERDLRFKLPDDWYDLSPGAPQENRDAMPPELLEMAAGSQQAAFAIGPADPQTGFLRNLVITLAPCPPSFAEEDLGKLLEGLEADLAAIPGTQGYRLDDHGEDRIAGYSVGWAEAHASVAGVPLAQMQYYIPGEGGCAVATYSTSAAAEAADFPRFRELVRETGGVREAKGGFDWGAVGSSAKRGAMIGGIVGALAGLFGLFGWRRRKNDSSDGS